MNKDSVRIFNKVVDTFLEMGLNTACHIGDNDMVFIRMTAYEKLCVIQSKQEEVKKVHAAWRQRGDTWTSKELEKEYGSLE